MTTTVSPSRSERQHERAAEADAAEFRRLTQRAMGQRSDGPGVDACLNAVAQASRTLLADRWAATQQADARRQGNPAGCITCRWNS